ncbi:MAG TPA: hypothetical protein VLA46_01565 [Saprospiraceae bacterium]|nr:hypothetical protein [Saprospiraceae bacterium]
MKSLLYPGICLVVLWTTVLSCKKANIPGDNTPEPIILAQVFDYKLYFDDIKDLIQGYANAEDSIQQVRSLTEHWVRDRLILVEAEKKFPKEVNMNKLLEDYRQSLLRHFLNSVPLKKDWTRSSLKMTCSNTTRLIRSSTGLNRAS